MWWQGLRFAARTFDDHVQLLVAQVAAERAAELVPAESAVAVLVEYLERLEQRVLCHQLAAAIVASVAAGGAHGPGLAIGQETGTTSMNDSYSKYGNGF